MRSGLMVENLTPQLGEFFGAKNGNGVLVRSVEKGSHAEKAGLRAGDVITRVGDQSIHDTSDFTHALHSRAGGSVAVGVIRDKKEQTLTITLPERKDSGELIEESLEAPELEAEAQRELSDAQNELAKMRPQIELAVEESRKASRKAEEEVRKALCANQKAMKDQAEKIRQEIGPELREQLENNREKLQQEMEQLRRDMQAGSMDI